MNTKVESVIVQNKLYDLKSMVRISVQLYAYTTTVRNPNPFFFLFLKNSRSILLVRYNFVMQCTKSTLGKLN